MSNGNFYEESHPLGLMSKFVANIFANNRGLVLGGQYWRLITYQFVHQNLLHILFNLYTLVYLGLMIEHKLGGRKYAFIYLMSGICGGLVSILMHDIGFSVGASGAVMGFYGAFLALLLGNSFEKNAAKALLISTAIVVIFTLTNGLSAGVDNAAHLGGLVTGFVLTFILYNENILGLKLKKVSRYLSAAVISIAFVVSVLAFTTNYQPKEFEKLQMKYSKNVTDYYKLSRLTMNTPTVEKLAQVEELGIEAWKRNLEIVEEMRLLRLNERDQLTVFYFGKIAAKSLEFVKVLKLEVRDNVPQYKKQMDHIMEQLQAIKIEGAEKTGRFYH